MGLTLSYKIIDSLIEDCVDSQFGIV